MDCNSSIQKLTERKKSSQKVTDREGGTKPATLLKSLADSFEEEDATGDDIDPDVAELLKKRWGRKLNPEKIKEIVEKHKRPANCLGEQGRRSGDCTRLPPKWPGFGSGLVATSGLSWLLVLYSAPRGFSPGSPVFPSPQISTFPNSNSIGCRTSLKTTFG